MPELYIPPSRPPAWIIERAKAGKSSPLPNEIYKLWDRIDYKPWPSQRMAVLHPARVKQVTGGVRAGKSHSTTKGGILPWIPHSDLYWIVGPDYEQARPEFQYLMADAVALGWVDPNSIKIPKDTFHPCSARTRWGCEIYTKTSADLSKLAGRAPDGIAFVEAGQQGEGIYLTAHERMLQSWGPIWMSGTLESSERWYAEMYYRGQTWPNEEDLASFSLPTYENESHYPGGLNNPRIQYIRSIVPEDLWLERYCGIPVPARELVFQEFSEQMHVAHENPQDAEFDPNLTVDLYIDPGHGARGEPGKEISVYAVLAVQWPNGNPVVIDEISKVKTRSTTIADIIMHKPWWPNVRAGVIDVASRQERMGLQAAYEEISNLLKIPLHFNYVRIEDGIWRLKTFLWDDLIDGPRLLIHPRCSRLIFEFHNYKYPKDKEGKPVRTQPVDRYNDAIKALIYGLIARSGYVDRYTDPEGSTRQRNGPSKQRKVTWRKRTKKR